MTISTAKLKAAISTLTILLSLISTAPAQTPIRTAALSGNQIALVKTAQGITTRISFPDIVKEIICGDLYDPGSGRGAFVVQRGDNDVFLKPVAPTGTSNLFVRIGRDSERIYSFDLSIGPANQACRVFNVVTVNNSTSSKAYQSPEAAKIISDAEQQAREIIEAGNQRASQLTLEAERRTLETERKILERSGREIDERFIRALMMGIREIKISNASAVTKGIVITLDQRALVLDGRLYLRYMIQNLSYSVFDFQRLSLESGTGAARKAIEVQIMQSKSENSLKPREALAGVITLEQNAVNFREGLTLCVRGQENAEIARVSLSE
ncbi:MAG TPA: hypothetical protein VLM38_14100 [Blastocatellia bacterium]|nr:hypothetical protein [Blastocatellia bacterium]